MPATPTNEALRERFIAHLATERRLAVLTAKAYSRDAAVLLQALGDRSVTSVTASDLRRFIAKLHAGGLSGTSLARTASAWRQWFELLTREGYMSANPARAIKVPKSAKRLPAALSPDDATRLVTAIDNPERWEDIRDRAMFELAYSSGLRVSELTGVTLAALDMKQGDLRVTGKGGKARIVPVGAAALQTLATWLTARTNVKPATDHVFINRTGKPVSVRSVQLAIKRWAALAGITQHVHPHMLRHSFASHVLQSSQDLRAVQELLGHASISSTQVYTHLDFQHLAKIYDAAHPRARRKT